MQVSIETKSGLERRMVITVPAERVDEEVTDRLRKAAKNIRLAGFRPGKVPLKEIRRRFGDEVQREVAGDLMQQSYVSALQDEDLSPAGQPQMEILQLDSGLDFRFAANFEVLPDVELQDLSALQFSIPAAEITDDDLERVIESLREQKKSFEEVSDRAAQEGDKVTIDFTGFRDDEAFEGGSGEDHELELGSGQMIPGFEDGIVGMSPQEQKSLDLTFPEDYNNEDLAGAQVRFDITVKRIEEASVPELDEAFVTDYGIEDGTVETFRADVRENMERELKSAISAVSRRRLSDAIVESYDFALPDSLLEQEQQRLRAQMLQGMGIQDTSTVPDELLPGAFFGEEAKARVKTGLFFAEMQKQRNIDADVAKIRETIEELASAYDDPQQVINYYYSEDELLASVESRVIEDQLFDVIIEEAGTDSTSHSYDEIMGLRQEAGQYPRPDPATLGMGAGASEETGETVESDNDSVDASGSEDSSVEESDEATAAKD